MSVVLDSDDPGAGRVPWEYETGVVEDFNHYHRPWLQAQNPHTLEERAGDSRDRCCGNAGMR